MCRFLLAHSTQPIDTKKLSNSFTSMCQKSRTLEGDLQEDGWGIAWIESGVWKQHKSLNPIWTEKNFFDHLPITNTIAIHARSATFAKHKKVLEYNQPFIDHNLAYVFNGHIKGVRLSRPVKGDIGAQKIFSLIKSELVNHSAVQSLENTYRLLVENSQDIKGANIGLIDQDKLIAVSEYQEDPKSQDYFQLHSFKDEKIKIICSQPIEDFLWKKVEKGEVIVL